MKPTAASEALGRYASHIAPDVRAWLPIFKEIGCWVVCAHEKPDADTLGSSLALARLLRRMGARAEVVCADPVVARFGFMPGAEDVWVGELPIDLPPETAVVALDAADLARLGTMADQVNRFTTVVNLDHHISNQGFGSHSWVDVPSAATAELVIQLYDFFDLPLDIEAAIPLYGALITDTGFFRYPATTARTLAMASDLVATGLDFAMVIAAIYERQTSAAVRLQGAALADLSIHGEGRVASTAVSLSTFAALGAREEDAEGIVERMRDIEGVEVMYVLRESREGGVRVSLRAKHEFDVNEVARQFGGGGHRQAAGCVIDDSLANADRRLRDVVLNRLSLAKAHL